MDQTGFADTFIKGMLGWIRWVASSIANLFQTGSNRASDGSAFLMWFADNWLKLLIALIVIGVFVDWIVWMLRWRPYWIWFRKRRILLDSNVEDIDDDDMMLRYGGVAEQRERRSPGDRRNGAQVRRPARATWDEMEEFDDEDEETEASHWEMRRSEHRSIAGKRAVRPPKRRNDEEDDYNALYEDISVNTDSRPKSFRDRLEAELSEADEDMDDIPRARTKKAPRKPVHTAQREEVDPFDEDGDFLDDLYDASERQSDKKPALGPAQRDMSVYMRPKAEKPGTQRKRHVR